MDELEPVSQGESPQENDPLAPEPALAPESELAPEAELAPEPEPTPESEPSSEQEPSSEPALSVDELMQSGEQPAMQAPQEDVKLKAVLEAVIYVAEEPLT